MRFFARLATAAVTVAVLMSASIVPASAQSINPGETLAPAINCGAYPCPDPGYYYYGPTGYGIYDNSTDFGPNQRYVVWWSASKVEAPPAGQVPQWFTVYVFYQNRGTVDMSFTCGQGRYGNASDPKLAKEWFYRDGKVIGYVAASSTTCSLNPLLTFTLHPGEVRVLEATFHNVPWVGDFISLEWGVVNPSAPPRTVWMNPFHRLP